MGNVLEFALGLKTSEFLGELGISAKELLSFTAMAEGAHFAIEQMGSAIERGAHLNDLSARTGETVGHLYQLEEAFKRAGVGAESVGPMILKVRKALTGVNEMGGNTNSIFATLGLDRQSLAAESPLDAIQQITAALHKLNFNDATGAAGGLFGKGQAGDILQLANNAEDVAAAFARSKTEAALFARNAKAFDELGDKMGEIKSHIEGFWAGLASGLAPEISKIEDMIAGIDFTTIGLGVVQAFKDGVVTEIITQAFLAALEKVTNMISGTLGNGAYWAGVWQAMKGSFESYVGAMAKMYLSLGDYLLAVLDTVYQKIIQHYVDDNPLLAQMAGLGGFKASSVSENMANRKEDSADGQEVLSQLFKTGTADMAAGIAQQAAVIKDAYKNSGGPEQDKFTAMIDGLVARIPKTAGDEKSGGGAPSKELAAGHLKPEVSDLEKIGFIFGSGNGGNDAAQQTAKNTQLTVDQLINLNTGFVNLASKITGLNLVNS